MATERNWHKVKKSDRKRIRCLGKQPGGCGRPAWFCQHVHWDTGNTKGLSFFYFCRKHAAARGIPS